MLTGTIPFDRYPGLAPLFHDFLRGLPEFFPDPPTIEAAAARGKRLLGTRARIPAEAFRTRVAEAEAMARDLAAGRAVAVVAGHQVGLFTGPLFTITKAFDAIRAARELREAGVPAVPVFWALTDDHDLAEIARTARPGKEGPEVIVLEGADRANRRPVGGIPLPQKVSEVLESFRADARAQEAGETLEAFARRYAPGVSYGEAFIETLFDLVGNEPLLVLDPRGAPMRRPAAEFLLLAARKEKEVRESLRAATAAPRKRRQVRPRRVPAGSVSFLLGRRGREAPHRGPRRDGRRRRERLRLAFDGRPDPPGLQVFPDAGRGQRARRVGDRLPCAGARPLSGL